MLMGDTKRQILFLDSLLPQGFGDEAYRAIFRFIDGPSWPTSTYIFKVFQALFYGFRFSSLVLWAVMGLAVKLSEL